MTGSSDRVTQHVVRGIDARHPCREPRGFFAVARRAVGVVLARKLAPAALDLRVSRVVTNVQRGRLRAPERATDFVNRRTAPLEAL